MYKILRLLFSEREAGLVALLPIKPFTAARAAEIGKTDLVETRKTLDEQAMDSQQVKSRSMEYLVKHVKA